MEFLFFLFEALLWLVDLVAMAFDLVAWFKGRANRIERRDARRNGEEVPTLDAWNRRAIVLTTFVVMLTGIILYRLLQPTP